MLAAVGTTLRTPHKRIYIHQPGNCRYSRLCRGVLWRASLRDARAPESEETTPQFGRAHARRAANVLAILESGSLCVAIAFIF